jgi:hypothetical protein
LLQGLPQPRIERYALRNRPRRRKASRRMTSFVDLLVPIAVILVVVVLVLGLINMMRGGSANTSQKLMRLRVLLQFGAIIVIMGVIWWRAL